VLPSSRKEVVEKFNGLRSPSLVFPAVLTKNSQIPGEVAFFNGGVDDFLIESAGSRTLWEEPIHRRAADTE
jgi:hypothetical protein